MGAFFIRLFKAALGDIRAFNNRLFSERGFTMRVALYLRVSTSEQTTDNQRRELAQACERHQWSIVQVFEDAGISGAKGREDRPAFDKLHKAIARREFDLVAAWSVDRIGRSLQDLIAFLGDIHAAGIGLYLHQQGLDTTTPSGRAMFQMMGVFAEFERAMIAERTKAGLRRALASGKRLGRPGESRGGSRSGCAGFSGVWRGDWENGEGPRRWRRDGVEDQGRMTSSAPVINNVGLEVRHEENLGWIFRATAL
jgi:DNA invertase Pin-like site-specific DNA recombinase